MIKSHWLFNEKYSLWTSLPLDEHCSLNSLGPRLSVKGIGFFSSQIFVKQSFLLQIYVHFKFYAAKLSSGWQRIDDLKNIIFISFVYETFVSLVRRF